MILLATVALPAQASSSFPFASALPVAEDELADARGGFIAPSGLALDIRIQLDTAVDGALILRSVFAPEAARGSALQVFAPAAVAMPSAAPTDSAQATGQPVMIAFERTTGVSIAPATMAMPRVQISSSTTAPTGPALAPDLAPLAVTADGPAVTVAAGQVQVDTVPTGTLVTLTAPDLEVRHLVGTATVNAVANTASNRIIDTTTTLNVILPNASAFNIGPTMARVDDAVLMAARGLAR